jgi:hypothetical protein
VIDSPERKDANVITALHVERGRQMRQIVQHDIVTRGLSFEASVSSLAEFLGVDVETVKLGIAIANEEGRVIA